jgi:hypothetical protein
MPEERGAQPLAVNPDCNAEACVELDCLSI